MLLMRALTEAHAQICGELKDDIMVKSADNGTICGLIHVLINDQFEGENHSQTDNIKTDYIPVLLKGTDIIKKHSPFLKKGERVWLIGKFKIVENVYITFENFGFENIHGLVIIIYDKKRLTILPRDTTPPNLKITV